MSIDLRTRTDAAPVESDPATLLDRVLPAALEASAERLRSAIPADLAPLVVEVEGDRRLLSIEGGVADLSRPDGRGVPSSAAVLHLTAQQLADLVVDQCTPISWLADGSLRLDGGGRGGLGLLLGWWLVLRGALDGTVPHVPGAVEFVDRDGRPLDLGRSFTLDDPVDERAHFLHQAGFLHLRGVFDEGEMAAISADMDREAPGFSKGDGRSWWAVLQDGTDALVRMQAFDRLSEATARVIEDERLAGVGDLTGDGHVLRPGSGGRCEALFKPLGVREGISDIPWHKDCSLGRHSFECCSLTIGVSITGADAESGQLRVVAGSNRALMWPAPSVQPGIDLPVVDLPTGTGDLTVHCSCTLHMAQPPVTSPRRVVYTSLVMEPLDPAGAAAANARRNAIREAAPVTVSQPAAP